MFYRWVNRCKRSWITDLVFPQLKYIHTLGCPLCLGLLLESYLLQFSRGPDTDPTTSEPSPHPHRPTFSKPKTCLFSSESSWNFRNTDRQGAYFQACFRIILQWARAALELGRGAKGHEKMDTSSRVWVRGTGAISSIPRMPPNPWYIHLKLKYQPISQRPWPVFATESREYLISPWTGTLHSGSSRDFSLVSSIS